MFIVVSSFISAAQEDDTLKNVRLKSTLSFVRITSMVKEEGVEFSFANHLENFEKGSGGVGD